MERFAAGMWSEVLTLARDRSRVYLLVGARLRVLLCQSDLCAAAVAQQASGCTKAVQILVRVACAGCQRTTGLERPRETAVKIDNQTHQHDIFLFLSLSLSLFPSPLVADKNRVAIHIML